MKASAPAYGEPVNTPIPIPAASAVARFAPNCSNPPSVMASMSCMAIVIAPITPGMPIAGIAPRPARIMPFSAARPFTTLNMLTESSTPLDHTSLDTDQKAPQSPVCRPVLIASYISPATSTTAVITACVPSMKAGKATSIVHFQALLSVIFCLISSSH